MTSVLIGKGKVAHRHTGREHHMKVGAEIRTMHLQAKNAMDCCQPPETRKKQRGIVPRVFRESMTMLTP